MTHELVLEGKAYVNNSFQDCCIGIDEGKITEIKKILSGDKYYRFSKKLLLPAGIDAHVHFREPGMTRKETIRSGSIAAAFGGISCVFDMPNTCPAGITKEALTDKKRTAERTSIVDFGFHAGVTKESIQDKSFLRTFSAICHGFKLFLGETTNALTLPSEYLLQTLTQIKPLQKPVFVHAEDEHCLRKYKRIEQHPYDHHMARPSQCELNAIENVISAANKVETLVHICHVSSAEALQRLQQTSSFVSYGITPHHSLLHLEKKNLPPTHLKVNPPLRFKKDQQKAFETIQEGNVFLLESDHAPHTVKEKNVSFSDAPAGIPGVETMYPLFLAQAMKNRLLLSRVILLLCERPAEMFHLSKGRITKGFDADIIVLDRRNVQRIQADQLHSKAGWTPFEGFQALFPSHLFIRGTSVIKDYEQSISSRYGQMIPLTEKNE